MIHGSEFRLVDDKYIDRNDHMNNTRGFGVFFEDAREKVLRDNGFGEEALRAEGFALHMKQSSYEFVDQVFSGEGVYIDTTFEYERGLRVTCRQQMERRSGVVATSTSRYFFASSDDGRPKKPTRDLIERLKR